MEYVPIISVTIALLSFLVAFAAFVGKNKDSAVDDAMSLAEMKTDIKYIKNSIDKLSENYEALNARMLNVERQWTFVVEKVEQTAKRVDKLEDRQKNNN